MIGDGARTYPSGRPFASASSAGNGTPAEQQESTDAIRLAVKELAQFVHRHGDIHYRYEHSSWPFAARSAYTQYPHL